MRNLVILSALLLSSCVSVAPYAQFSLAPLPGANCSVLQDSGVTVVRHGNSKMAYAIGSKCPRTLPDDETVRVFKREKIEIGPEGRYARMVTPPDKKTGVVTQTIVRKRDGGRRGIGVYRWITRKID